MLRLLFTVGLTVVVGSANADRLVMSDGQEIVGQIISETPTQVKFESDSGILPIPKSRIRTIERVDKTENLSRKFDELLLTNLSDAQAFLQATERQYPQNVNLYTIWKNKLAAARSVETTSFLMRQEKRLALDAGAVAAALDQYLMNDDLDSTNSEYAKALAAKAHLVKAVSHLDRSETMLAGDHAVRAFSYIPSDQAIAVMEKCFGKYSTNVDDAYKLRLSQKPDAALALKYAEYLVEQQNWGAAYKILKQYTPISPTADPNTKALYSKVLQSMVGNHKLMADCGIAESEILQKMQVVSPGFMEERHLILQFNRNQGDANLTKPLIDYMIKKERYIDAQEYLEMHFRLYADSSLTSYHNILASGIELERMSIAVDQQLATLSKAATFKLHEFLEKIPKTFYAGTLTSVNANIYSGDYDKDSYDNYETVWVTKDPARAQQLSDAMKRRPNRGDCVNLTDYINRCRTYQFTFDALLKSFGVNTATGNTLNSSPGTYAAANVVPGQARLNNGQGAVQSIPEFPTISRTAPADPSLQTVPDAAPNQQPGGNSLVPENNI